MADVLQARVQGGARRYRGAVMRYLMRPPLSLRLKYAGFLIDLSHQSDHMQEVLSRSAERVTDPELRALLSSYLVDERARMQVASQDLRRLGFPQESWPQRPLSPGDSALRAYGAHLSFERPAAMLGMLLMFVGVAAEICPTIIRLLTVGGVSSEAMRWLHQRAAADPHTVKTLREVCSRRLRDPADQVALLEAVEVSGELLGLSAAGRAPMREG